MIQQDLFNIIESFCGQKNILTLPSFLIKKLDGDHLSALFLSQLIYWQGKTKDNEGWIYKSYDNWNEELVLSKKQVLRIKKKLEELNLIETKLKKINGAPTLHYKCVIESIINLLLGNIEKKDNKNIKKYENEKKVNNNVNNNSKKLKNINNSDYTNNEDNNSKDQCNEEMEILDCSQMEQWKMPKGNNGKLPKETMESYQREQSISNIDYLHKLLTKITDNKTNQEKNTLSQASEKQEKNRELLFLNFQNELFEIGSNFRIYTQNNKNIFDLEFKLGLEKLKKNKFNYSGEVILKAYTNYMQVIKLQQENKTYWNSPGNFDIFCSKNIFLKFLPKRFNLKDFQKTRDPPVTKNIYNTKKIEKIPF